MSKVSITLMLSLWLFPIFGQQLFDSKSKIIVQFNAKNQTYFIHKLVKGQGVKGLPQVVKKTAKDILVFNGISTEKPTFKSDIMVPIDMALLIKSENDRQVNKNNYAMKVPVYYKVRKGETIFKIAKNYNNEEVDQFIKRNKLKTNQVKPGLEVIMGWLPIEKSTEHNLKENSASLSQIKKLGNQEDKTVLGKKLTAKKEEPSTKFKINPKPVEKDTMKRVLLTDEEEENKRKEALQFVTTKGVAIWQQSHKRNNNRFVLHDKAPINSTILLYNPMAKKSISAKVVGRIPQETYHDDIDIVLSSGAANSLGALDTRFMIEMKYKQ